MANMHQRRRDREVPNLLDGRGPVSRRRFLELLAAAGAAGVAVPLLGRDAGPSAAAAEGPPLPPGYVPTFPDGVIAGDPRPDGAVIWTRLGAPGGGDDVGVLWEVAESDTFSTIAAGGIVTATAADDHAAKVLVDGLGADRWYHYRFTAGTTTGPVGRLRTAPAAGSPPDRLKYAWASCQQRNASLYNAHTAIQKEPDLDFWMHLGDYIYVSDGGTITLGDYREKWHTFKANDRLQALQARVPLVATWDDGEFYNGVDSTGPAERLAAGRKAWIETMPVIPTTADQIHRPIGWGSLAEILMLDTRQYRDPAVEASSDTRTPEGAVMLAEGRTTLGAEQKAWLKQRLADSPATWKLLGNSYNMAPTRIADLDPGPPRPPGVKQNEGVYFDNEAWDDYAAERRELLQHLADRGIRNVVSTSGHTHVFIASHLIPDFDDPASPLVAFDFTCGSLTADPDVILDAAPTPPDEARANFRNLEKLGLGINQWLTHLNFIEQGYATIEVTPEEAIVEFKLIDTYDADAEPWVGVRFRMRTDQSGMSVQGFGDTTWQQSPLAPPLTEPTTTTTTTSSTTSSSTSSSTSTTGEVDASSTTTTGAAAPTTRTSSAPASETLPRFTG